MKKLKYFKYAHPVVVLALHVVFIWGILALGYNSYKEVMFSFEPISTPVKDSIKAIFPWGTLIFMLLYLFFLMRSKHKEALLLQERQYGVIILIYALVMNVLFVRSADTAIAFNLSVFYMAAVIVVPVLLRRSSALRYIGWTKGVVGTTVFPAVLCRMRNGIQVARDFFKQLTLSGKFFALFLLLLALTAFMLVLFGERYVKGLSGVVYLFLVLGVGARILQLIRNGDGDETQ